MRVFLRLGQKVLRSKQPEPPIPLSLSGEDGQEHWIILGAPVPVNAAAEFLWPKQLSHPKQLPRSQSLGILICNENM